MATRLSPHFTLEELTATQHRRFDNTPSPATLENLRRMAERMEEVRSLLGDRVIKVSSGYRSPAVNSAVGGAKTSAHLSGLAVDFTCQAFGSPAEVCAAIARSGIVFDQLIEEGRWIHLSADPRSRRQVLTKRKNGGYRAGLGR